MARRGMMVLSTLLVWMLGVPSHGQPAPGGGSAECYERLLKLRSIQSVLHITAHPDDEHGGVLTRLSRGEGVHTSLLSLTRGEAGANAIGAELFDALGTVRSEELRLAGSYYGLDFLGFTRLADYGYSKRFDEARDKWPRAEALRDLVWLIRRLRPQIILARFQGTERDGHGQHQFAGWLAREAYQAAADPTAFSDQLNEGVVPWQAKRFFLGGLRADEDWDVAVSSHDYSPRLGMSYEELARRGLSMQRSQTSGRFRPVTGEVTRYYRRVEGTTGRIEGLFHGLDMSLASLAHESSRGARLAEIERSVGDIIRDFDWLDPSASTPSLSEAYRRVQEIAGGLGDDNDTLRFELERKLGQLEAALISCLGLSIDAIALPAGSPIGGDAFSPIPVIDAPSPGDSFDVLLRVWLRGQRTVRVERLTLEGEEGLRHRADTAFEPRTIGPGQSISHRLSVDVADDAAVLRPTVSRDSLADSIYRAESLDAWSRARPAPVAVASARIRVDGIDLRITAPATRIESKLPLGHRRRILEILPNVSVFLDSTTLLMTQGPGPEASPAPVRIAARVVNHGVDTRSGGVSGSLRLIVPDGVDVRPSTVAFNLEGSQEPFVTSFELRASRATWTRMREQTRGFSALRAVARVGESERDYSAGFQRIDHPDLGLRYQIVPAASRLLMTDVTLPTGMQIGYIMGVGDAVPSAIEQLGARVSLLGDGELAQATPESLAVYDAIVVGTRAYAVREGLRRHNEALLGYCHAGGNLIVLYNTPEFIPELWAPYPASLPRNAEEVSEEDAPVRLLMERHPVMRFPNRISAQDFEGWLEQRGSKFWSQWDSRYEALVASHDIGQPPQRGGWLHANYGAGHYTYFAYSLHRQLPYAVEGAYRLLANLLAQGATSGGDALDGGNR